MNLHLENAGKDVQRQVKELYIEAFPADERMPLFLLKRGARHGSGELLAIKSGNEFAGLAYLVADELAAYLFFFAVCPSLRGKGCGTAVLDALKKRYSGRVLFLAREELDDNAPNAAQRAARHRFYLRNGFTDTDRVITEKNVRYAVMTHGGDVSPADYDRLLGNWCGKTVKRLLRMKMY